MNEHGSDNGWRLSLGLAGVPAVILFIASLILPETPNSLIERGRVEEGRRVLAKLRNISAEVGGWGWWRWWAGAAGTRQFHALGVLRVKYDHTPLGPAPPSPCLPCTALPCAGG